MTFMTGAERVERDRDGLQFRAIFAILLPACVFAAATRRLTPDFWRTEGRRAMLPEAWDAAGTAARFALGG